MAADTLTGRAIWQRLTGMEKAMACAACAGALAGTALIADGLYTKAKASLSQVLLQRSFTAELSGTADAKPWPWADFVTEARIAAPHLGETAIVLGGATGETLAFGPAHLDGTPLPGEAGTSVLAAHRDTHFRWLKELRPGDPVEITRRDGRHLVFRVKEGRIAPWNQSGINASALGVHLALATCWPFDAKTPGPLRYIVDLELDGDHASPTAPHPQAARYTSALSAAFLP